MNLENLTKKDNNFILNLNEKVRKTVISDSDEDDQIATDNYLNVKISEKEIERVLDLVLAKNVFLHPIISNQERIMYQLVEVFFEEDDTYFQPILRFTDRQLHKKYDFLYFFPYLIFSDTNKEKFLA